MTCRPIRRELDLTAAKTNKTHYPATKERDNFSEREAAGLTSLEQRIRRLVVSNPHTDNARWFAENVQPHESSLRAYLRTVFPSLPDVDDLVQESYARLIQARSTGTIAYAKAFLFTTARNVALDLFRRRKVVSIEGVADLSEIDVAEDRPDVGESVNRQQELEMLADAVRRLPDRCRHVLTLRLLYGYSHREIAAELRISEHTVKAQLAKGMRRCADYFEEAGVTRGQGNSRKEAL